MKMVGGTGIIGQDMVCSFGNDKKYLKKLPAYGITLSNGVKDTVEKIDGKKTVVQRLGKVVLDGSSDEVWEYRDNNIDRFLCHNIKIKAKLYNERFPAYAEGYHFISGQTHEDKGIFLFPKNPVVLAIYNYTYKTLDNFKAYLAQTPLEVYYELENPIYTQI